MSDRATDKLRAVLVGCGGMGRHQAKLLAGSEDFELAGVCDVDREAAEKAAESTGAKAYADFAEMLAAERPDTVSICTANDTHAMLTGEAAAASVRGVYCEKPMATCLADARAMVAACASAGAALVVNHQRRLGADLVEARRLIEAGSIGEVRLIRAQCAGDVLSDGTHAIDSVLHLCGDREVQWVLGQVHRDLRAEAKKAAKGKAASRPGFRYGHPVESGAMAVLQVADGPRVELFCGDLRAAASAYQDYEVFGTAGRLWRTGDGHRPNLFVQDAHGGGWQAGMDDWTYKPIPAAAGGGPWQPVNLPAEDAPGAMAEAYRLFARVVRGEQADHPMSGANALRGFEVVMAVYESARVHGKVPLPLAQERFALELMIEAGAFD